jgi:hypothetical protein
MQRLLGTFASYDIVYSSRILHFDWDLQLWVA